VRDRRVVLAATVANRHGVKRTAGAADLLVVKGAKTLIPGSKRSGSVLTLRQILDGSPPLCATLQGPPNYPARIGSAHPQVLRAPSH
jgi:hypothetical protein